MVAFGFEPGVAYSASDTLGVIGTINLDNGVGTAMVTGFGSALQRTIVSALRQQLTEPRRGYRNGPHAYGGDDQTRGSPYDRRGEQLHVRSPGRACGSLRGRCRSVQNCI